MNTRTARCVRLKIDMATKHRAWSFFLAVTFAAGTWSGLAGQEAPARNYSGWRGGIGIAFGAPSQDIPDVTELGYEIAWGGENPLAVQTLNLAVFRYWNSVVETSLRGPAGSYDFSGLTDKEEAARRAFDAAMAREYGVQGLSKYANVRYQPKGAYGDVYGTMELDSENDLTKAVMATYLAWFEKHQVAHGGIGLDNAGGVPKAFLEVLTRELNAKGLGIAANGCPDQLLSYIDFFCNEGFPFSIDYARQARNKGLRGVLGEFTMQQLASGELEGYLKNKLFNGIVFFGYTDGGVAAGAAYSMYGVRPDIYEHQRWVFRKYVPLSRAAWQAGRQEQACATFLAQTSDATAGAVSALGSVQTNAEGKIKEAGAFQATLGMVTGRAANTPPAILRYGTNIAEGITLYVDSGTPEAVACDAKALGLPPDTLVFDAFEEQLLPGREAGGSLVFRTRSGPSLVQLGTQQTLVHNLLAQEAEQLQQQLRQRSLDQQLGTRFPQKVWPRFCQGWNLERKLTHSGNASLRTEGGTYTGSAPQWRYFNRQGAAQLVSLDQATPQRLVLRAWSRAEQVPASETVELNSVAARRRHFAAREGHTYCLRLYLDYQDGQWPEVQTVAFTPGSHDWEEKTITVNPTRPVKTALVLLEFHQPEGRAWFDDLVLTQANAPTHNLLACPGFEAGEPAAATRRTLSSAYEERVRGLLDALAHAQRAPLTASTLPELQKQVETLQAWVAAQGLALNFPRELRDLNELRRKLLLCAKMAAR
jgi:hypothetical protein